MQWFYGVMMGGLVLVSACAPRGLKEDAQAEPAKVTLLFLADLHAQLEEHPELFWRQGQAERITLAGGFPRLAAALDSLRAQNPQGTLTIDGGDTFQGSGGAALSFGQAVLEPLKRLKFDVAVPGNWEVTYGVKALLDLTQALPWPWLAANASYTDTGKPAFPASAIFERQGVRIGVVGYTDPDVPLRQPPVYSAGLSYAGPESLNQIARELRESQDVDVVVLVSHIGLSRAVALSHDLKGFDLHLSADTHERSYKPVEVNGMWVVEPGAFGSFIGKLDLEVLEGRIVKREWELLEVSAENFPEEDAQTKKVVEEALAPYRETLNQQLATAEETLVRYHVIETSLDLLLTDALRETMKTDVALSNGFRFGTPLLPGPVREADLWNMYPVVTRLMTGEVTGQQLLDFWEREIENALSPDPTKRFGGWLPRSSGMQVTFEAKAPKGQRVRSLKIGGKPVDPKATYTVTACEREGDKPDTLCRIPKVKHPKVHAINVHEAVRAYLKANPKIRVPQGGRAIALDLPKVMRSQAFELEIDHEHKH